LLLLVLLEGTHERHLVLGRLEATVTELGARVDEFQLDLLQSLTFGVGQKRFAQGQDTFLGTDATSLDHDKVLLDFAVMRETTHRVDGLVRKIVVGRSVVLDQLAVLGVETLAEIVDLLVDLGTVMVSLLTGTGDGELDTARMPSADTSDLTKTLVRLTGQFLGVPTRGDTLESFALGDADDIDHFVFSENAIDGQLLFKVFASESHFVGHAAAVKLDFDDVRLLLTATQQLLLSVHDHTDNGAVLLDLSEILLDLFLAKIIVPFLAGLGESLLLGFGPVLVEATLAFLADMFGPDSLQGTKTTRGFNVTDDTDADHRRRFDDRNGFDDLPFVHFAAGTVSFANDMGHTGLEAQKGRHMNGL